MEIRYLPLVKCLLAIVIACFTSVTLAVTNSELPFHLTQDDEQVDKAKALLNEVIRDLPRSKDGKQDERLMIELLNILITNRQYEEAEQVAKKAGSKKGSFYAKICKAKINDLADSESIRQDKLSEIKRLASASNGNELLGNTETFRKLLNKEEFSAISKIIHTFPHDLSKYKYQSGSYTVPYFMMSSLAQVAGAQMRVGNSHAAKAIFDQFGDKETRDKARTNAINDNLLKSNKNPKVAEQIFELIESETTRYMAAYRLGTYFGNGGNLEKALLYSRAMDDYLETNTRYQSYQTRLLTSIAYLQIDKGEPCKETLKRIEERSNGQNIDVTCIQALSGDIESASADKNAAFNAISKLLDLENRQGGDPFSNISQSLPKSVSSKKRIDIAIQLAETVEHPYAHAMILCEIASRLSSNQKVSDPDTPDPFGGSLITQRTTSVVDPAKAKELMISAIDLANETKEPYVVKNGYTLDQPFILQRVAAEAVKVGLVEEAMEAIELIPDSLPSDPRIRQRTRDQTLRETAMLETGRNIGHSNPPFMENDGEAVLRFVKKGLGYKLETGYRIADVAVDKFIELERWDQVEKIHELVKDKYKSVPISGAIGTSIAISEDIEKLKYWNDRCEEVRRPEFFFSFCRYFKQRKILPKRSFLIELDSLASQHSKNGGKPAHDLEELLILGFWHDGLKDEAREKLTKFPKDGYGQNVLTSLGVRALEMKMPDLMLLVAEQIESEGLRQNLMVRYRRSKFNDAEQDENWLVNQPIAVQLSWKIKQAKMLLEKDSQPNQ